MISLSNPQTPQITEQLVNDLMRDNLKPGDMVFNWGNNSMKIKKVSKKSITDTEGTRWTYGEIHVPMETILKWFYEKYPKSQTP